MTNLTVEIHEAIKSIKSRYPTPSGYRISFCTLSANLKNASDGLPSQSRIRFLLNYNPATGVFNWRVDRNRVRVGQRAGKVTKDGYIAIGIDGGRYSAHRLAFIYMIGENPDGLIDHVNGNRSDNRWSNLRVASNSQNQMNTPMKSNNSSGYKGVSWDSRQATWRADIRIDGRKVFLGYFETRESAHAAYTDAARQHHGAFARVA